MTLAEQQRAISETSRFMALVTGWPIVVHPARDGIVVLACSTIPVQRQTAVASILIPFRREVQ